MLFSEFQKRLEATLAESEDQDPETGLRIVRALGWFSNTMLDVRDLNLTSQATGHRISYLSEPFIAIASSVEPLVDDRRYCVVLATPPTVSPDREQFVVVNAQGKQDEDYSSYIRVLAEYLPPFAYIEGGSGTLTVGAQPTLPEEMCMADERRRH